MLIYEKVTRLRYYSCLRNFAALFIAIGFNIYTYFCIMKWVVYIFSFYILALACIPCSDRAVADTQTSISSTMVASHADQEHHMDYCSPLCVCSCCSVQITPLKTTIYNFIDQRLLMTYALVAVNPPASIADNIWQPPQLV